MSSPSKQQQKKGGGWGSLLSGAVAGLESRLDTILADDPQASAKSGAAEAEAAAFAAAPRQRPNSNSVSSKAPVLAPPKTKDVGGSRDGSRTRTNDRLAERLAKATAAKTAASSVPSRTGTPSVVESESPRASVEQERPGSLVKKASDITDSMVIKVKDVQTDAVEAPDEDQESRTSIDDTKSAILERVSVDSSARPSLDLPNDTSTHMPSKSNAELEAELITLREGEHQRQEEMHAYMEKIDALQAKLSYLANETVAAAKAANAATPSSDEAKLAEKDERIALLMQEGEKLSKNELKHLQTIKKLRFQKTEDDKSAAEVKKREADLRTRLRTAERDNRQAVEKAKQIASIEKQVEELRVDRENATELVKSLTVQLKEAKDKATAAEREAREKVNEVDKGKIAALENELEDAQIEKKLAEDRATAEIRKTKEDFEGQKQRFGVRELELKNEIAGLESRVEAMRSRAEEAVSTSDGASGTGESSVVQLLRQVETLQRQYALAKENWEAIEASLNGRVAVLERERDEAGRREVEARKKGRDVGVKARRVEEELEGRVEEARRLEEEVSAQREVGRSLEARLERSEKALEDAKAEAERQRRVWEVELQQRVEEERLRWQHARPGQKSEILRNGSPATSSRKIPTPTAEIHSSRRPGTGGSRLTTTDLAAFATTDSSRPSSRRSSAHPILPPATAPTPTRAQSFANNSRDVSPGLSRQESSLSLTTPTADMPPTPSIEIEGLGFPENPHSPDRTINDLVSPTLSITTAGAGPSVQLVERMSAAVRRLESEKAAFKDEIARLSSQRDSARDEVVTLMREVEQKGTVEREQGKMKGELEVLRGRYEASLEMLGEREEECEELRADVGELKRLYRELVEDKVGGK